jgi:putative acetyltransferase
LTVPPRIRPEEPGDGPAIRVVHDRAFGRPAEGRLVAALQAVTPRVSLVAADGAAIVGHILFTPVVVESTAGSWTALGLAPMAVLPEHQRRGVGSALVRDGLRACRALGEAVIFVLGHPGYYPRFGFRPARPLGLSCEFDAPDDAFLVVELSDGALAARTGRVRYRPEFASLA